MASKPYIGTLQGASQGVFGEKFESTDPRDTTDLKTGLLTFDLSAYDHAPDSATFEMNTSATAATRRPPTPTPSR